MKVVYNADWGGFGLSDEAFDLYYRRTDRSPLDAFDIERHDPVLVAIVEKLGEKANTTCSDLRIVEFPDEYDYYISDYDGLESVTLRIKESHLRTLIQRGIEDDIVDYVMMKNRKEIKV